MSRILRQLLEEIPLPNMIRVRQRFDDEKLSDPLKDLRDSLRSTGSLDLIRPGQRVAVVVGSRGVSRIAEIAKTVVDELKGIGALPVLVPGMGSHGGATGEGQRAVLAHLGIDEAHIGAPVRSSMDVVLLGHLDNGLPVYADKIAATEADAIVAINRVKPHTAFRGPIESGLLKMVAVGLGKQKGAEACHQLGFQYMAENVPAMAKMVMKTLPVAFGVATVENAYDQICHVEAVPARMMEARETELLVQAKARLPRLLFDPIDVLVIDQIGKNISGDGMDPNITGRYPTPYAHGGPAVNKMVVLDVTAESHGNVNGVGTADFTTRRLVDKADWPPTYANGLTSTVCSPMKMPTVLDNDWSAIKAAVKTCNVLNYDACRMVWIRDTLHLGGVLISEALLEEAEAHPDVEILSAAAPIGFDEQGSVIR